MKVIRVLSFSTLIACLLVACGTPAQRAYIPANGTPDPALQAQVTLLYAHATDTQAAQQAQLQAATDQAYQAMIYSTQVAAQTQTAQADIASQTQGAQMIQGTQTAANMTAWANVTVTALLATQRVEAAQVNSKIAAIWGGIIILLLLSVLILVYIGVKIYDMWVDARSRKLQSERIEPDMHGRYSAVPDTGKKWILPDLAHRAVIDPEHDDLTTEQALANTQSHRDLEITRALAGSNAFGRQMAKELAPGADIQDPGLTITKPELPLLPGAPSWSLIESWDGQGGIPYGVSGNGLEFLDLARVPHIGVFGKTGKGKSRYFLRPALAAAIAAGHRVLIMGKQADFRVFADHPNVTMLPVQQFTNPEEAARYADFLKRIVEEMNRRDGYLVTHNASTWEKAGRENTLLVLDELGNALAMMPPDIQKQSYRWIQGLVQEGRKAGFNIWLASQRAVGFKPIVEQLGRAVFYLADADASRHALGFTGAEELDDGQFFAKFGHTRKCLAFDPSDDDIARLLHNRQVPQHEPIDWIDAQVVTLDQTQPTKNIESQIRDVLGRMKERGGVSLSQAQREVFGENDPRGGAHFRQIQDIWVQMQAEAATATAKDAPNGTFPGSDTGSALGSAA